MCAPVIGIDPGVDGGIALRHAPGAVQTWRVPSETCETHGRVVCVESLNAILTYARSMGAQQVAIERVGGIRGQSASAAFNFGRTCGAISTACALLGLTIHYVPPQTWRAALGVYAHARRHGLKDAKAASRAVADHIFPDCRAAWAKAGAVDLAEAALISEFCAVKLAC